ncbi:hypothetical protein AN218_12320, partial [Streptomyces nanshensis]
LLDAWSYAAGTGGGAGGRGRIGPAALDELSREVADDAQDGPVHLARLVAAMETSAQATGGSLARVSDTPAVTRVCGGALHHLIEVLHGDGLRSATTWPAVWTAVRGCSSSPPSGPTGRHPSAPSAPRCGTGS